MTICGGCGRKTSNPKFCSRKCQALSKNNIRKLRVENDGALSSIRDKRYLIETRGHRCEICGTASWMNQPVPLVLDHTNGNSDDWSLTNVRLLCSNCDAQTPTYKSKNRGNGRHSRRERYARGVSF